MKGFWKEQDLDNEHIKANPYERRLIRDGTR